MLTIYYNGDCSKCRGTLELIRAAGRPHEVISYIENPPTPAKLDELLRALGLEPEAIVRKGEERFSELGLDRKPPATREEWLRILHENPILIERPIVTDGRRAVIARPPEKVHALLAQRS